MREKIVPIEVTPEMMKMLEICKKNKSINPELYAQYDVKRGLRDINGKGVLAGLTEIGEIHAYDTLSDGSSKPDRKSTRLNSSHPLSSRMPSSA